MVMMLVMTMATAPVNMLSTNGIGDIIRTCANMLYRIFDLIYIQYIVPTRIRVTSSDDTLHVLLCNICYHHP